MSAEVALLRGRRLAESLMVDTCTIRRRSGQTQDPDTGVVTPTYTILYSGQKCRVQSRGYWGQRTDVGQNDLILLQLEVQLPIAVTGLRVHDEITVTASVHDPDLVNRRFVLKDEMHKSHATSRRVMCTEITG